ncbi:MAG TPA: diguanylate cyclase [Polyangiaceae bacterium]|jgi:two-component system cell cycle response regulator|nr:diguanylate cyclase [Polyangiaceae bacterium]
MLFGATSTAPPTGEQRARLLVIIDDEECRKELHDLFEVEGYEVISVGDTDEVFRLAAEFEPDIIVVDVDLPSHSGFEICGELRASDLQHQTPIVLAGTTIDEDTIARSLFAGADDYIVPTRKLEVRARIRVQLRNKRYRDALARVRSERDSLRRDLRLDALTGILNRRSLEAAIHTHLTARERFAVLFCDIDHFKSINDRFGHDVGDTVLKAVSEMLKQGIRPGDAVGRYGGEEFVLVISGAGPESARLVAERHRKTIEGIDFSGVGPKQVTLSIGVAVYEPETSDEGLEELLRRADLALYRAKNTGRNCVLMAPPVAIPSPTLDAVRASRRPPAMTTIESRPPSATATRRARRARP